MEENFLQDLGDQPSHSENNMQAPLGKSVEVPSDLQKVIDAVLAV